MASKINQNPACSEEIKALDKKLSNRFISLDPSGYFIIKVDSTTQELVVEHFSNDIDAKGRAVDPENGKVLGCHDQMKRSPLKIYRGRSAKDVGIQMTEGKTKPPLSRLDHALYLGRELQRAENCLQAETQYIQD